MLHPIFSDEPALWIPETAADYWQILTEICPFEIVRELPHGFRPSRSRFYPGWRGEYAPFAYIHPRLGNHWASVRTLAHEVGHALDHAGQHPAQSLLGKSRRSDGRYRVELAATTFCASFLRATGLTRQKGSRRYITQDRAYVERYKRPTGVRPYTHVLTATQTSLGR